MPISFDLSNVLNEKKWDPLAETSGAEHFQINFGLSSAAGGAESARELRIPGAQLVRRVAHKVAVATGAVAAEDKKCERADDEQNDQYTIRPGKNMCWAVLCRHDTGRRHPNSLLGDFGHLERLPAWLHLVAGIGFAIYAVLRPIVITKDHTLSETFTTAAAGAGAFCFLSSTAYHITAPSRRLAYFTRQLDFFGIYLAIAMGNLADYAIATNSFQNVSLLSVLDGPLAAIIVCVFFWVRRGLLPSADTWSSYLGGCTLKFGLLRRGHIDLAHTGARQATSFLLAISYFVATPSLFNELGTSDASVILGVELACFAMLALGMLIDNAWVFPDDSLAAGKGPNFLACPNLGCIASAHSLWHLLSVVAACKGTFSREYALYVS
jgi:predicted membrane channel-forming protein YqfA (hemolysin III family)